MDIKRVAERLKKLLDELQENSIFILLRPYLSFASVILFSLILFIMLVLSTPVKISKDGMNLSVPRGATLSQIADSLDQYNVINSKRSFILAAHLMFKSKSLKAGYFDISLVKNYRKLIHVITQAQNLSLRVTIQEGLQTRQIARLLADKFNFDYEDFMAKVNDQALLDDLGIKSPSLDGYLFPDTYDFYLSDSPYDVINKTVERFRSVITDTILKDIENSNRNLHEILTLASIVEGECLIDRERPIVSSVYINSLKLGMRLESDPTIQYIIPDGPRRLLTEDLFIESPYNTYRHRGLPPGPINNPGLNSIMAAVWPANTNYLYMVARGDGSHSFTHNYNDFLRAKRRFQRYRRQVEREKVSASD